MEETIYDAMLSRVRKMVNELESEVKSPEDKAFLRVWMGVLYLYMEGQCSISELERALSDYKKKGVSPSVIRKFRHLMEETVHYKERLEGRTFDRAIA